MAFTPVEMTNGTLVEVADTPEQHAQYLWEGWVETGGTLPAPEVPLADQVRILVEEHLALRGLDKLVIGSTRPTDVPPGTVFIDND